MLICGDIAPLLRIFGWVIWVELEVIDLRSTFPKHPICMQAQDMWRVNDLQSVDYMHQCTRQKRWWKGERDCTTKQYARFACVSHVSIPPFPNWEICLIHVSITRYKVPCRSSCRWFIDLKSLECYLSIAPGFHTSLCTYMIAASSCAYSFR